MPWVGKQSSTARRTGPLPVGRLGGRGRRRDDGAGALGVQDALDRQIWTASSVGTVGVGRAGRRWRRRGTRCDASPVGGAAGGLVGSGGCGADGGSCGDVGGWAPARATGVAHRARHSTPAGAANFMRVRESVGRRIGGPGACPRRADRPWAVLPRAGQAVSVPDMRRPAPPDGRDRTAGRSRRTANAQVRGAVTEDADRRSRRRLFVRSARDGPYFLSPCLLSCLSTP